MIAFLRRTCRLAPIAALLPFALMACSETPNGSPPGSEMADAAPAAQGDWVVDPAASYLAYVSLKAGEFAETNRFQTMSGTVGADGAARIEIDLASVDTGVEIRDERMRDIFFQVADFPSAVVTAQLDPASFSDLEVGAMIVRPLDATVALKGMEADVFAQVQVARVSADRVLATTTTPIIVTTDMFGLTDELGELRGLAQLPSISPAVPVTFTIAFQRAALAPVEPTP